MIILDHRIVIWGSGNPVIFWLLNNRILGCLASGCFCCSKQPVVCLSQNNRLFSRQVLNKLWIWTATWYGRPCSGCHLCGRRWCRGRPHRCRPCRGRLLQSTTARAVDGEAMHHAWPPASTLAASWAPEPDVRTLALFGRQRLSIWPLAFCCCALVCMRAYCILCKTIIRMHVYCMPLCVRMRAYCLLCFLRARCRHAATPARGGPPGATTPAAARRACCCTCSWRSLASVSLPARTRWHEDRLHLRDRLRLRSLSGLWMTTLAT